MSGPKLQKAFAQYCQSKKVAVPRASGCDIQASDTFYKIDSTCICTAKSWELCSCCICRVGACLSLNVMLRRRCALHGFDPLLIDFYHLHSNISLWWTYTTDNIPCAVSVRENIQKSEEGTDILLLKHYVCLSDISFGLLLERTACMDRKFSPTDWLLNSIQEG